MDRLLVLIFAILLSRFAQSQTVPAFSSTAEIGGYVSSSDQIPFWLRANQWGIVPLTSPVGTARLTMHYRSPVTWADSARKKAHVQWEIRAEGVVNSGKTTQLLLPESYAKLHWKQLEFLVGRERRIIGIVDTTLSSGSYSWSGNALPVPMVRLGLSEYLPLGFLKNFLSIKGSFAHGWFWDTYIRKSYLHQKTLHGRFGKPEGNFHVQVGMVHHVMWGGEADYLVNNPVAVNGKLTSTFQNYVLGVVLAQIPKEKANAQITTFDGVNRIGNHLGHYDFAVDWRIRNLEFRLYRQHPFEDASGLQFQNLPDGLSGLSLRRRATSPSFFSWQGLVLEYLVTKDQTGDDFTIPGSRFTGGDAYFNHVQYIEGWSYKGSGLGTPLIPNKYEVREGVPLNNLYFPTNRIILYHLGLEGLLAQKVRVLLKISNSHHYPSALTPRTDPIYRQFSSLLSLDAPLARWGGTRLKAQIAYDQGDVLPNSFGGYLGIKTYIRN